MFGRSGIGAPAMMPAFRVSCAAVSASVHSRIVTKEARSRVSRAVALIVIACAFARPAGAAPLAVPIAATGPSVAPSANPSPLFTGRDLGYAALTAGVVLGVATQDLWLRDRVLAPRSGFGRRLAADIRELGDGAVLLPALAVIYGASRLTGHPGIASAVTRIGVSTVAGGVSTLALKRVFGRSRPSEAPDDTDELRPFSGHESMPSGHTTIAFAFARSLDRETGARWVPWVAYPAAALVGWSRVHDDDHWTSDVVAGAAVGLWAASKAERFQRHESAGRGWFGLRLTDDRPGIALTFGARP